MQATARALLRVAGLMLLAGVPGPVAGETVETVRARAAALAGRPVALDPRHLVPACPQPHAIDWREAEKLTMVIACPELGRRLVLPVLGGGQQGARGPGTAPLVRRGERVVVVAGGEGFRVSVEAVAEASAGAGERVALRNSASGQRFTARVEPDGQVVAGR
jgi:flagella basal body P-ring formation protein FlgA